MIHGIQSNMLLLMTDLRVADAGLRALDSGLRSAACVNDAGLRGGCCR